MPVTVYKSTDGSAPVLDGQAGSLVAVLDAILVNGYGAKAAAGWAIAFTGTNKRAYRAAAGARHYLRVQDDAPAALALGREARIRGFETMSSVDAGTGGFIATGNGLFPRKSLTPDATARPWVCVADSKTIYFFTKPGDYGAGWGAFGFGEFYSLKPTQDDYRSVIMARITENQSIADDAAERMNALAAISAIITGHFVPRLIDTSQAGAVNVGKHGNAAHSGTVLAGLMTYPNPQDGGLYLSQVWLHADMGGTGFPIGRLRGFWHFLHPPASAVNDGDTWSGTGPLAGKAFMAIKPTADQAGLFVIETSDTWETN